MSTNSQIEAIVPLSPMQQGMLADILAYQGSGMYVSHLSAELEGEVDKTAFKSAWSQVSERHGVLRTSFVWEGRAEPLQIVRRTAELPWDELDWQGLTVEAQGQKLQKYIETDRALGFDLKKAPLMRLSLIRTGSERYLLVWSHHHLMIDGWSVPVLLSEAIRLYEGYSTGRSVPLPSPKPYTDYIEWLQRQDLKRAEAFWRELLYGFDSHTQLGLEQKTRKGQNQSRMNAHCIKQCGELGEHLGHMAQRCRLTINTIMQGAWGVLLSRYSGDPGVVFGATSSGRAADLPGIERMVGLFINTLPVRLQLRNSERIIDCLRRLQSEQAEARRYEFTPLVRIQRWSEVPRSRQLFDTILVFENYPVDKGLRQTTGQLVIRAVKAENGPNNYPLTATVGIRPNLQLRLDYDQQLYEAATIERMMGHWERLLEEMVAEGGGERRLGELEMLSARERQQVLEEWNQTETAYPSEKCVQEMFEEQVEGRPEAGAVGCVAQSLSYGELNRRANQVAHYLRELGVGPEVRVGLCLERSVEMLIGLLGILKAGATYVPLEPNQPAERLRFILTDAQIAVVLTNQRTGSIMSDHMVSVVPVDGNMLEIRKQSIENIRAFVHPPSSAYVIYTSGSTGRPKGVEAGHGALAYKIYTLHRYLGGTAKSIYGSMTSLGFDPVLEQLLCPICAGGTVLIIPDRVREDSREFADYARQHNLSILMGSPSLVEGLLCDSAFGIRLETLIVGGDVLSPQVANKLLLCGVAQRIFNLYGPTETCIDASGFELIEPLFS